MSKTTMLPLAPVAQAAGQMNLPGSKSISNRVLLLAALAQGETRISGLLDSDDTRVMLQALDQLGVRVDRIAQDEVVVHGGSALRPGPEDIHLGNAGTAFRPLTAALALSGGEYRLSGVPRMHERPIGDLVDALRSMGADILYEGNEGYPPLRIGMPDLKSGMPVRVKGSVSSQFLTALLMAAPLHTAATGQPLTVEVEGELISKPYINITLNLMDRFGVKVTREGWQRFVIGADAAYRSPGDLRVEGDASTASYFMALGAIGGGPVVIHGVGGESIQGDITFADVLERMGAKVRREAHALEVSGVRVAQGGTLRAFDEDFNLIPDAAMTAAVLGLFADGPCTLRNIGSWRVKETDRIHAMHTELEKLGATVASGDDWLTVHPLSRDGWKEAEIATYDDHRMAMCFSLASFGPKTVTILDPECVGKTFPGYFPVFQGMVS
ncbi:3-phosphoshikimate 1-carboxyvinyltransferase [Paracandidimonas soli]|uniref:3-phosphoshikimate 1-carboxyvinyltransferase n=1 Tax=Paracandidimonas soli TaxID=1917182 RepID=A0A4R3VCV7_9BURK|nr:3-phosphoshikimate 1-carboxyvinyltransferase [Paracandidimonas soli]TCV01683.1 3-phosphoshikimate 1-carboxyvinyltransferase [Paracandidimonas soli]